ncbi:MAG: hypothetical protein ACE366_31020 [Bradymonadia bacterium]
MGVRHLDGVPLMPGSTLLALGLTLFSPPLFSTAPVDHDTLPKALAARNIEAPPGFKAMVIALPPEGLDARIYDYEGTGEDRRGWWPASTVKLYAALAALEVAESHGFSAKARVGFGGSNKAVKLSWLVRKTLIHSHNRTFDRLGQIAGPRYTHTQLLNTARGLDKVLLAEGYSFDISGFDLTWAPKVTFLEGSKRKALPERRFSPSRRCGQRNCTSVGDLVRAMALVMLHDDLPDDQRLALSDASIALLKDALGDPARKRGLGVAKALKRAFRSKGRTLKVWHKPGFYPSWRSDVLYAEDTRSGERWLVGLAGRGGRDALNEVAYGVGLFMQQHDLEGQR